MTWADFGIFMLGMFAGMGWGYTAGLRNVDNYRNRRKKRRKTDPSLRGE